MTESLTDDTITEIVQHIEPTWDVQTATPAVEGAHIVSHLEVETETGTCECVLKATPPEREPTCGGEARLLALLDTYTDLSVPTVLGVVDDHEEWPTPLFLASTLPGANCNRTELSEFDTGAVETLARSTGRHLAALHSFDAVDAYGFVGVDDSETLDGGRPSADTARIAVEDPTEGWTDYLEREVDRTVPALAETRFGDLTEAIRPVLEDGIEELTGPFEPVVGRIDQSLDNVIVDPETSAVTGLLDWEFCVAATPAYDLAFVAHSLAGGHWAFLPDGPDHKATIRDGILAGYLDASPDRIGQRVRDNYGYYRLLPAVHAMLNFESWFVGLDIVAGDDDQLDAAAANLRKYVSEVLDDQ